MTELEPFTGDPIAARVEALIVSPIHRYEGRPADGALPAAGEESHREIELRAGLGIVGDRYFNQRAHRHAAVTLIAAESLEAVAAEVHVPVDPVAVRRNIVLRGVDVDALRDVEIELDSGQGPVVLRGRRPANPCAWMDTEVAPGAFRAMRRRGGMRCEVLAGGILRLGAVAVRLRPAG